MFDGDINWNIAVEYAIPGYRQGIIELVDGAANAVRFVAHAHLRCHRYRL
jgi:hypothetical protein